MSDKCPCGSGKMISECCDPIIKGEKSALTAEMLMRSRYTAYTQVDVDYILGTTSPKTRDEHDEAEIKKWAEDSSWERLEILSTEKDGEADEEGKVEFMVEFVEKGLKQKHHELSTFKKIEGKWYFVDGEMLTQEPFVNNSVKVKRNDPCPCGSGKKYKKCCGSK